MPISHQYTMNCTEAARVEYHRLNLFSQSSLISIGKMGLNKSPCMRTESALQIFEIIHAVAGLIEVRDASSVGGCH